MEKPLRFFSLFFLLSAGEKKKKKKKAQEGTSRDICFLPSPWLYLAIFPPCMETSGKRGGMFIPASCTLPAPAPACHPAGVAGGCCGQQPEPLGAALLFRPSELPSSRSITTPGAGLGGEQGGRFTLPSFPRLEVCVFHVLGSSRSLQGLGPTWARSTLDPQLPVTPTLHVDQKEE